jgi:hypothetical protein
MNGSSLLGELGRSLIWCRRDRGEVERAVELYALACRYPIAANSQWGQDVYGEEIAAAAAGLSSDVVAAAEARGRARDLWETLAELAAEFRQDRGAED